MPDSARWCEHCKSYGNHHSDRCLTTPHIAPVKAYEDWHYWDGRISGIVEVDGRRLWYEIDDIEHIIGYDEPRLYYLFADWTEEGTAVGDRIGWVKEDEFYAST